MWYMISAQDVENSLEKRLAARPAHLARLQELADEGRLLVAGHRHMEAGIVVSVGALIDVRRDHATRLEFDNQHAAQLSDLERVGQQWPEHWHQDIGQCVHHRVVIRASVEHVVVGRELVRATRVDAMCVFMCRAGVLLAGCDLVPQVRHLLEPGSDRFDIEASGHAFKGAHMGRAPCSACRHPVPA